METHRHGKSPHSEIAMIEPRLSHLDARIIGMEDTVAKAFPNSPAVLEGVKTALKATGNPERVLPRYMALFDTLFKERVFEDNDRAWNKLTEISRPDINEWGDTPDGFGFTAFGLALKTTPNPEGVLDTLKTISEIAPREIDSYSLARVPLIARTMQIMVTAWSDKSNLGVSADDAREVDTIYPSHMMLGNAVDKVRNALRVCQDPMYLKVLRDRAEEVMDGGQRRFDNSLLWWAFIRGTAEAPEVVELLLTYKKGEAEGKNPSSFDCIARYLGNDEGPEGKEKVRAASINIEPAIGLLTVAYIGTGHSQMLTEYGVPEEYKHRFLPGAVSISKETDMPHFQITGGLENISVAEAERNLSLVCNQLKRWGFDGSLEITAYIGSPDALKATIGELAGRFDARKLRREMIEETEIRGLADMGDHGFLVLDKEDKVWDLQGGSVIQSGKNVAGYCYYQKENDNVRLYNIKAKHFDISSDSVKIAERMRALVGGGGKITATGEFLTRG
jgi:hypothetical protein